MEPWILSLWSVLLLECVLKQWLSHTAQIISPSKNVGLLNPLNIISLFLKSLIWIVSCEMSGHTHTVGQPKRKLPCVKTRDYTQRVIYTFFCFQERELGSFLSVATQKDIWNSRRPLTQQHVVPLVDTVHNAAADRTGRTLNTRRRTGVCSICTSL